MLHGFITGILNKYIGAYFENIDASQLTGSLFGGGVQLHDIFLRPSVLETLGLPFHIVAGKCGTLEVKYSLTRLYSEPVTVTLKDLYLLVIPTRSIVYDAKEEAKNLQQEKMRQLEVFESIKNHVLHPQDRKATGQSKSQHQTMLSEIAHANDASYFDMWVMTVLRNIVLNIESVHVRFEDEVTKKHEPFALGITLDKFSVITTDALWRNLFVKEYAPETIYKFVNIVGLNVYWNSSPTTFYKDIIDRKIVYLRLSTIPKANDPVFKSMFGPVSLELKLQVTPFPDLLNEPFSKPRLLVESGMDRLSVTASDKQFQDIIPFLDMMELLMKSHKFRKHRAPLHDMEYKGHYKEWWQYAYACILDDIRRRRNNFRWSTISEHREKCKKYLRAYYKKKIENKSSKAIDDVITQTEREFDLLNIIILRKQAEIIGMRQKRPHNAASGESGSYVGAIVSWFTSFFLWDTPPTPPPVPPEAPASSSSASSIHSSSRRASQTSGLSQGSANTTSSTEKDKESKPSRPSFSASSFSKKEKEELWIAIGFAKNNDLGSCPEDYADIEANILLNKFLILIHELRNDKKDTILEAVLEPVSFSFRSLPAGSGIQVALKMGRVEAYGGDRPRGTQEDIFSPPQILTTANPGGTEYFLKILYEKAPIDSEVDHKVTIEGLALQFTYHAEAIDRIVECFTISNPNPKPQPKGKKGSKTKLPAGKMPAAKVLRKALKFKNSPTAKLLKVMENKGKVELSLCLISPYLVIPLDSAIRGKSNFVVVQLGEINVIGTIVGGTICQSGGCSDFL